MNTLLKKVEAVIPPSAPHMVGDGFRMHGFFPNHERIDKKRMSPFFLMDYNAKMEFAPRKEPRGVGVHPHRGFETVTIVYHGRVAHHDSAGNSGVIGEGEVQWMTAGAGLLHKEYHEQDFSEKGGPFQMVQLWVNLPAKNKMTPPKYQEITRGLMGKAILPENAGEVEIIAGSYNDIAGPAKTFTPIQVYNLRLNKGGSVNLRFPANHNTGMLQVEGSSIINDASVATDHFILFKNEGEEIKITANEDSVILVLSGEPIHEPIAQYGPFLMNKWEELEQAIADVSAGKFGVLED